MLLNIDPIVAWQQNRGRRIVAAGVLSFAIGFTSTRRAPAAGLTGRALGTGESVNPIRALDLCWP